MQVTASVKVMVSRRARPVSALFDCWCEPSRNRIEVRDEPAVTRIPGVLRQRGPTVIGLEGERCVAQVCVEETGITVFDDVHWPLHRVSGDRHAARERHNQPQTKGIGAARKHEHVCGRQRLARSPFSL